MIDFVLSLIKYTAIFVCMLYAYTKLFRLKLKAWDLFDIPLFIALSAVLHFVAVYVKILVPVGFLIFGIIFLFVRFRKTFSETVTVGTISLGLSIVLYALSFIVAIPVTIIFTFIKDENLRMALAQLIVSIIQSVGAFLLFKIKRLKSGVNPKGETATFEILLLFSVGCIFALMLSYTKYATQSIYEIALLVVALFGLLLIIWWRRHITYTYRKTVERQGVKNLENEITELKANYAEKELQLAVFAELFHYLNKIVPDCALLAESAATQTGNADACAVSDTLQRVLSKMNLANEKCSLKNIPQTGVKLIDAPIIQLFASSERKNFIASADISADVEGWFTENKLDKYDIHEVLGYLCDNAMNSALGSPNGKVRVELGATENKKPLIRIYDSGEQFDEQVLAKLGLEQITTRAGGNGIGLFTVFEVLAKYGASFTLDEAPQNFGFTKFIEIAFDGRRSVLVRTRREGAVAACTARKGITVERIGPDAEILRDGTNG